MSISVFDLPGIVHRAELAAAEAQLKRDSEALCFWCSDARYDAAVWAEDGNYYHRLRDGKGAAEWCDATLLWSNFAEQDAGAAGTGPSETAERMPQ